MSGRLWPVYLIVAASGTAASAAAGSALGSFAVGQSDVFYTQHRLAEFETPEPAERAPEFIAAAADLDSQWPVGSVGDE